jgi:hypothetical protein
MLLLLRVGWPVKVCTSQNQHVRCGRNTPNARFAQGCKVRAINVSPRRQRERGMDLSRCDELRGNQNQATMMPPL